MIRDGGYIAQKLINREFSFFLLSRLLFTLAMRMVPVLLGWHLYELTGSKFILGLLGLSEVIPAILLALPAGVRVDSSAKKALIIKTLLLYLLVIAGFGLLSYFSDFISNIHLLVLLYLSLVAATGAIRAFLGPAFIAILAQVVKKEELVKAASMNSMTFLMGAIVGPTVAGIIVGYLHLWQVFAIAFVVLLLSIAAFMQIAPKPVTFLKGSTRTWDSVKEGLVFVWNKKDLLGAMSLDMFAVLFGGAVALLPVFAKDILDAGPQAFGILMSATYLGNFISVLILTIYPLRKDHGHKLIYSVAGFGVCIIVFALSKSVTLSFIALFISGLLDGVSVIIRNTIFQVLVPDDIRGRVSSVNSIFVNSSNELGQFESGLAATVMGTVPSVIFGGLMTIFISTFMWIKNPKLRNLEY